MGAVAVPITEEAARGLRQVAEGQGLTAEVLADQAIRFYLLQEAERKIEREEAHYRRQHARLLQEYSGQFIAMHEGRVY